MGKKKPSFYSVFKGNQPGVYTTWEECEAQVKGFNGAKYKGFFTRSEADTYAQYGTLEPPTGVTLAQGSKDIVNQPTSSRVITQGDAAQIPVARPSTSAASTNEYMTDEAGWLVAYSDGACKGNGKPGSVAGVGVWWGKNNSKNIAERCPGDQTNNRAELIAIIRVLETAPYTQQPLVIKTDSKYSVQCFRDWIHGWQRNNWKTAKGDPVKNAEIIKYISSMLNARSLIGQRIKMEHVRAHIGIEGNEGADTLANEGARRTPLSERDWVKAEKDMWAKVDKVRAQLGTTKRAEVNIVEEEVNANGSVKTVSNNTIPVTSFPAGPIMSVDPNEINMDDYSADDILDDDDLARELAEG